MVQQYTHAHPLAVVSVAAHEDTRLLTQWETHLRPLEQAGFISVWSEGHLAAGIDRVQAWKHHLEQADLIVLLLSADFFACADCQAMMEQALKHAQASTMKVIPLLLRPVAWEESPLQELTPWPSNGKPITQWDDLDAAWESCVQELRRLLGRRVSEALGAKRRPTYADPDWGHMLGRLQRSYKGLLDQSLRGIAWVELGLSTHSDLVSNVTNLLFRLPQRSERLLPPGTSIVNAYDEAEGELLILGMPGAGKSTILLDLAQQLVGRAGTDPTCPLPVIFQLSSWARERPALTDWMIEQLSQTYDVPRQLSEQWVKQGRVLPLLDGLDEMKEAARPACIAIINSYHRTHLVPLVVCSRQREYEAATTRHRLMLQNAVIVQPLSEAQIEGYLSAAGPSFAGVRTALQQQALRELATTPLMLSVLLLTYRGATASEIVQQGTELERQVWTDYVARQITEKGSVTRYPLEPTRTWLSWLAKQMRAHQQTVFYAEYLQDDWLAKDQQRTVTWLATRLPAILLGGCVGLLVPLLLSGGYNYVFLLQMGLLGGFVGNSLSLHAVTGRMRVRGQLFADKHAHFRNALLLGLLVAASNGLYLHPANPGSSDPGYLLNDWLRAGCILGLDSMLSGWVFLGFLDRTPKEWVPVPYKHLGLRGRLAKWMNTLVPLDVWLAALLLGIGTGLNYGLKVGHDGLSTGLNVGLSVNVIVVLVHAILAGTIGSLRFAERIRWTWRSLFRPEHLRTSLTVASALFFLFGLSNGLSLGLSYGLSVCLSIGLSAGLSIGLSIGLNFWMLLGLYQGMKQVHLKDQDRRQFNQGIHRSLRNGLLISLISALIISLTGGLSYVLNFGLNSGLLSGLGHWLSSMRIELTLSPRSVMRSGLRSGLILLFPAMVVMWSLLGGLTILRHYVIRWLLTCRHTFPFRAQEFLDDATTRTLLQRVGGGYSFIHRRLQDYFADAVVPPSEN